MVARSACPQGSHACRGGGHYHHHHLPSYISIPFITAPIRQLTPICFFQTLKYQVLHMCISTDGRRAGNVRLDLDLELGKLVGIWS